MKLTDPTLLQKARDFCSKAANIAGHFKDVVELCDKLFKNKVNDTDFIDGIFAFKKSVITKEEKKSAAGRKV